MRAKLIELRHRAGYTQYSFAKAIGVSRSHYSQIENGDKNPSVALLMRMKLALRYTNDDMLSITPGRLKRGAHTWPPKDDADAIAG